MLKKLCFTGLAVILLLTMLAGCGQKDEGTSSEPLRVGSLSMMNMLPLYVAQQEGLFEELGLNVEIIPFKSVLDRDTAMHAGELDIIGDDLFSAILLNKDEETIKVVAESPVDTAMFYVIAAKDSDVYTAADLNGVEVAVSLNTVIDFVAEKMLNDAGLASEDLVKTSIASMPLRLEMLNQGKIQAASFSRPLSDQAELDGHRVICDDSEVSLLTSCVIATADCLKERPGDVKKFVAAWNEAAKRITSDPQKYSDLMVTVANISEVLKGKIVVPDYGVLQAPSQEAFQMKRDWMLEKGVIEKNLSYEDVISTEYLPE